MDNQSLVKSYLEYLDLVRQNDPLTVDLYRTHFRLLLSWSKDVPIEQSKGISPSFPIYLANLIGERTGRPLSPRYMDDICSTARAFFTWCRREYAERFSPISLDWIECLKPNKANSMDSQPKKCDHFTVEDIRKIISVECKTSTDECGKASIAFLFLSGMRIKAFLTIPISCVDLENFRIYQLPSRGVATKFHKAAITTLLPIPDLLEVVQAWDQRIRKIFPPEQTWFVPVRCSGQESPGVFHVTSDKASPHRGKEFRKELKRLCDRAGISYLSPHKLRHGHAIYGINCAKDMKEYKALSQNLMHDSISITDGIYGNLNEDEIRDTLAGFTNKKDSTGTDSSNAQDLIRALIKLQQNPDLIKKILDT